MKLSDFEIGRDFALSGKHWRCTDVGSRVIVAIEIDDREDQSWFTGPPYAQIACEPPGSIEKR